MNVMITGASGQLGSALLAVFPDMPVVGLARDDLDITDDAAITARVAAIQPDVVINAAAWTDVDGCEHHPERAFAVNARAPGVLADACRIAGATLLSVSTDYVFGGDASHDGQPYAEDAPVAPANVYGQSKEAGEAHVRETLAAHQIVRTSWVYGAGHRHFIQAILDRARRGEALRVVDDQFGCPTWTHDLAVALREMALSGIYGTFHRVNAGYCSRFELAKAVLANAALDVDVEPTATSAFAASTDRPRARRPRWSVLADPLTRAAGFSAMRPWEQALREACVTGLLDSAPGEHGSMQDRPQRSGA
jgi:dTDP-4-dehydrorhamnose reductase